MQKTIIFGLLISFLMFLPAHSAEITNETKCNSEVEIVKDLNEENDLGEKFNVIVDDLIGVLEHLCERKKFEDADTVAESIRGMLATEEPAEGPKKSEQ